jgi:rare lipoprotein A
MRNLFMGCAMVGFIALSPKSEAMPPVYVGPMPVVRPAMAPKGEVGVASWYGMERQGKHTASGELFDNKKLTAAHRKLPFGTTVRVTNLRNHESTLLKINDRGPGINSRVIDVSREAAKELGFLSAGLARVEIDVVSFPNTCVQRLTSSRSPRLN